MRRLLIILGMIVALAACAGTDPDIAEAKRVCEGFGVPRDTTCLMGVYKMNRSRDAGELLLDKSAK